MKKQIRFILVLLLLSACSPFGIPNDSGITREQENYIRSAIVCDSKATNYVILNKKEELQDFFSGEDDSIVIRYNYKKYKDKQIGGRTIEVLRGRNGKKKNGEENNFYRVDFKRFTLPLSACRSLKTKPKYFL